MNKKDNEGTGKAKERGPDDSGGPTLAEDEARIEDDGDISMAHLPIYDPVVDEPSRTAFLNLSPVPTAQVGTRRLGMRRPRLD